MSCPTAKSKQTCAEGGASGVIRATFLTLEEYARKRDVPATDPFIHTSYRREVRKRAISGRLDSDTVSRLVSPEFATECEAERQAMAADRQAVIRVAAEARRERRFPDADGFIRAVTGKGERDLNRWGQPGELRAQALWKAHTEMIRQAYRDGLLDFAGMEECVGRGLSREIAARLILEEAHTLTREEFRVRVWPFWRRRGRRAIYQEHMEAVRKAMGDGRPVPDAVRAEYPQLDQAAALPESKVFPDELSMLARRVLAFESLDEYRQAILERVQEDYAEYRRLEDRIMSETATGRDERNFARLAARLADHIRWAFGFDAALIKKGRLPGGIGHRASRLWRAADGDAWCFLVSRDAEALRLRRRYSPQTLLTAEDFANGVIETIPQNVRRLLFDKQGRPQAVVTRQQGKIGVEDAQADLYQSREDVEILILRGVDVPVDVMLRYPDLVEKYGLG